MEGIITSFRSGRHTQSNNQMVVKIDTIDTKEKAKGLVNKTVTWTNEKGKSIMGKVSNVHGNKGSLRVIFEKGMPGQSLGKKVEVK